MLLMRNLIIGVLVALSSVLALADEPTEPPTLSAAQIVEKNVAARGGLASWQGVQGMVWSGKIETPDGTAVPFVLAMKRPNKTRFEINRQGQVQLRAFDGKMGWKLRPAGNGSPNLQDYTPEEVAFERDGQGFDGPLIDYRAKGNDIRYAGVEAIDGHRAYRLNVKLPSGGLLSYWVDAETFLDIRYERASHDSRGRGAVVSVYYRNYQSVNGLQLPSVLETKSGGQGTKLLIEKFLVNPPLDDQQFSKPVGHARRRNDTTPAPRPAPERQP
jgi:hypothetical protein